MNKEYLLQIAEEKYQDACLLFVNGRYSNSYYLFGYVAEFMLKAKISTFFVEATIPDKRFVNEIFTHDLLRLVQLAGLKSELDDEVTTSTVFDDYWRTLKEWSEARRYDIITASQSENMHLGMTDEKHGVYRWLRLHCC